jgi:cobalt-precorrin 5A hydrolase
MPTKIAIITINQPSLDSATRLAEVLSDFDIQVYTKANLETTLDNVFIYDKLDDILPTAWSEYDAIICILAIGAVVRKIAPYLQDKSSDPAILVINLALDKIIPLLSGHLGGANELANLLTKRLPNAQNFISTATDQTKTLAFDMWAKQNDFEIRNIKTLANISNRLINKQPINIATYPSIYETITPKDNLKLVDFNTIDQNTVIISPIHIHPNQLTIRPKVYLGIGCNKNTPYSVIEKSIVSFLDEYNLSLDDIQALASFEAKKDEKALLEFAHKHNKPIRFYTKDEINSLTQTFTPSASTKFFGLKGVAEPSSILASKYKELIIPKQVYHKSVTIACGV